MLRFRASGVLFSAATGFIYPSSVS